MVYAVSGACAGLAGVIAVGRVGAATPQVDAGLALQAVAAVLLGGTLLTGGAGSVVGTALGVLFIGILQNGLNLVGVESSWQYVVTGIILLISVMGSRASSRRASTVTTESECAVPTLPATQGTSSLGAPGEDANAG